MDSHRHDLGRLCGNSYRGRYAEALQCFAQVTRPWDNAQFLSTLVLANAGPALVRAKCGCKLAIFRYARIEVDDLLESALSTEELSIQALCLGGE